MVDYITIDGKSYRANESMSNRPQKRLVKDWRDELKANDILITKSGDLRVIRAARYNKYGFLRCVEFAIRKCSWGGGPTTSYDRSALKTLNFRKAEVKFKPKDYDVEFSKWVQEAKEVGNAKPRKYDCYIAANFA